MRHSELKDWYVVAFSKAVNSSQGKIDGVRRDDVVLRHGAIVPKEWFDLVPASNLSLIITDLATFDEYTPDDDEILVLYTLYPATKPKTRFAKLNENTTRWYRVTDYAPLGVAALRSVDGICSVSDVALPGETIPSQWLSALSPEHIRRLENAGVQSPQWLGTLSREQRNLVKTFHMPVLRRAQPNKYELEALYDRFPGANPDYKEVVPVEEEPVNEIDNDQEAD